MVALAADLPASRAALDVSERQDDEIARNAALWSSPTTPALRRYTGVLYDALDAASLTMAARRRVVVCSALFGLVGAVNLPIIHYSVLWWRTLHQGQSISITKGSSIAPELLWPLPLTMIGFTAIFAAVALMLMRADLARLKLEARLRRSAAE